MISRPVMPWSEVLKLARRANDHYSMTEREQELLYELALGIPDGGRIVELGICHGKTAVVLALVAKQKEGSYLGIDNFSLEGTWEEATLLLQGVTGGLLEWWAIVNGDTHDRVRWQNSSEVDFLVVDAGHDPDNVFPDCAVWIPQVKPGGIVVFDDVPSGGDWKKSCHFAVREAMEKWCGEWEMAAAWGKVWCWRKPL